eukprot:CAMPEP_0117062612 /NCGR_PEP_ID=MMETSP0472-20121206/43632_1 /TAXON_ID=693140 ORGANISM="Tiarina fusus, Strain LIS" /NCGR_SAMPLE_ID=MMETSP0472 /ASSEMBLY_ACC=CAM_ASM_000603 /LENGTH=66 /DNA_ID=CAMNT_0004781835 /DNA_START=65 /DNA_END=265 /DNA_ORIENTATION=+
MPKVKKFVYEDAPNYDRLSVKFKGGATPTLTFYNADNNIMEEVTLVAMSDIDIAQLLERKGFTKKA